MGKTDKEIFEQLELMRDLHDKGDNPHTSIVCSVLGWVLYDFSLSPVQAVQKRIAKGESDG